MQIKELQSDAEFEEALPVVRELHHDLDSRRYRELIPEMRPEGYRILHAKSVAGVIPKADQRGCPISARNEAVGVGQSVP